MRQLPPLNALRAFEAAARHLSFTLAARELGVTQAAISQQVKALESWLNLRLFDRRHRGLQLTHEGARYLPALTRHPLADVRELEDVDFVMKDGAVFFDGLAE